MLNIDRSYVKDFEKLGFGLFVHFGLYSVNAKGEWSYHLHKIPQEKYEKLIPKFKITKNWAKNLVKTAKSTGCKYITLTTRHHDGFSLYDTKGLSDYGVMNSPTKRDLIKEFVDECNANGIVPFFYHTLLDWHNEYYKTDFKKYIDYLISSVEILCTNYGKIGGIWFDGMWDKPNEDWQEDRLYQTIRKHQPTAMIINNTGLSALGKVGHPELDSVTFERGNPCFVDNSDRHRAGEMCQVLNDHWGYCKNDCNFKSVKELVSNLIDCRKFNCNFLINTGLKGNGEINLTDKALLGEIGKFVKANKGFIYDIKSCEITAENAVILKDSNYYYAVINDVNMTADENVQLSSIEREVKVNADIKNAVWLDNGKRIKLKKNTFKVEPFKYGTSYGLRIARFELK